MTRLLGLKKGLADASPFCANALVKVKRMLVITLVFLGVAREGQAQKEFNVWCFGANVTTYAHTGIKVTFDASGAMYPPEGCSWAQSDFLGGSGSLCDADGRLLFYTNGVKLYDRAGTVVPGGELNGVILAINAPYRDEWWQYCANQPSALVPGPDGNYYIFYWTKESAEGQFAYGLSYAVVDLRLNGGYGAVVRKTLLTRTTSPRFTVVRHANNRDFWVISRDVDSRGFQAFRLGRQGVATAPVLSLAGASLFPDQTELKAAPNGRRLACGALTNTPAAGPQACVCVYDFDNATGQVSNELILSRNPTRPYTATSEGRPLGYQLFSDCSFSPDSRLLYAFETYLNPANPRRHNDLWQYDLSQSTPEAIGRSRYLVTNVPLPADPRMYFVGAGLQLTPNGELWTAQYVAPLVDVTGTFYTLSPPVVRHPNVVGVGCGFELVGYTYLNGQIPGQSFPNVITNMLYAPPTLNYAVGCADDSVQFWAGSAGLPAGLRWDFGDPGSGGPANAATGGQVAHRYARSGTYAVRLLLADGRVLRQDVTIAAQAVDFTGVNVFTPNGDGLNEAFVPVRGALPGGRLRVFSRWGVLVFGTAAAEALRWDGAGAAAGEYFYELDYPDCQGQPRQRRGLVTLVR